MKKLFPLICVLCMLSGCAQLRDAAVSPSVPPASAAPVTTPSPARTPTPMPSVSSTPAPAVEFVAQAALPDVETGDWYEWDIAGNYPSNMHVDGSLYYADTQDILIRKDEEEGDLIISHLDGTAKQVLDTGAIVALNFYDGWLYYMKTDGIWKSDLSGSNRRLIVARAVDDIYDSLFIYDRRIYLIRDYQECIDSYNLDGGGYQRIDVPDLVLDNFFFEDGIFYYGAITPADEGTDCWSVYRYDLDTGEYKELEHDGMGPVIVRNGTAYYLEDGMTYNDGKGTRPLISGDEIYWNFKYNVYRNLLLYFKYEPEHAVYEYGSYEGGTLCAYNLNTGQETALFELGDTYWHSFYVTETSVFLYSGWSSDPVYRITFEDDMAYLWRLNGL